jgi:hypothetical protein
MSAALRRGLKVGLSRTHAATLARLSTPERIQDFIDRLATNFESDGATCLSVAGVLRQRHAHCIEAAYVAACALWVNGQPPLVMDLQARGDDDHVVALFRRGRHWGAISKSNHVWLRWRDPIYRSLRELAMSYFHEYVMADRKTLRRYSRAFDLSRFDPKLWITNEDNCWDVGAAIDDTRHYKLLSDGQARRLRRRDKIELRAGSLTAFTAPNRKLAAKY